LYLQNKIKYVITEEIYRELFYIKYVYNIFLINVNRTVSDSKGRKKEEIIIFISDISIQWYKKEKTYQIYWKCCTILSAFSQFDKSGE